jgi:UDP-glucose 4-epimerase
LVFASSGGTVYGSPTILPVPEEAATDPVVSYGITKLAIEKYCNLFTRLRGLKTVCLRLANAYGPRHVGSIQGAIPVFLKCILAGRPIVIWGDGSVIRDYVYVEDIAHAFLLAAEYAGKELVINIGSGMGVSLRQLLAEIQAVVQRPCQVEFEEGRPFDISEIYLDTARARKELNWSPRVTLREGLQLTWNAIVASSQGGATAR